MTATGVSPKEVRQRADDAGMSILRLDPLNTWSRVWLPDNMDDAYIATVDTRQDRVFALCAEMGCRSISLNATFPRGSMSIEAIIEDYAKICAASAFDLDCSLEFIPLWGATPGYGLADRSGRWRQQWGAGFRHLAFRAWKIRPRRSAHHSR